MGAVNWLVLMLTHPLEFRTLLQFWLYYEQKRDIKALQEHPTSGWDRATMRRCWDFLDMTSRSFSAVIKELEGDLARTICLFYLVLRGLDTVEDDMTIPDEVKQPILRAFHRHTVTPGWKFDGCGPDEKDRQLLVEYDVVVDEVNRLNPEYKSIIIDITHKMATGMADYAHAAATSNTISLATVSEYDLYCHYVAGLVGEGLSRIFSASGKEASWLGDQLELSNSMGLMLQKTNIIRDYREDVDQSRMFWPREIWGKYVTHLKDLYAPGNERKAQHVQSAMVLDALRHATDSLDYLRVLKNQSVFNFCAIPQTMAIATLELCFMNPEMFKRNIKIRKAEAAHLIMRSTNPREVGLIFREYARRIHAKADPTDPSFLKLSVACGKIEQWNEHNYPSFVRLATDGQSGGFDPADARTLIVNEEQKRENDLLKKKRLEEIRSGIRNGTVGATGNGALEQGKEMTQSEVMKYVIAGFTLMVALAGGVVWVVLKFAAAEGY